jgi:S-adenosylmethionine:tRNA ribosyltransferase-isomerase
VTVRNSSVLLSGVGAAAARPARDGSRPHPIPPARGEGTAGALDFVLPPELEAREPPEARGLGRDGVRLLVTARGGEEVHHARFADLPDLLRPGDLLVANDSATLPAALTARRADGAQIALHLSTRLRGRVWTVEPRRTEVAPGETLALPGGGTATILAPYSDSRRLWVARLDLPSPTLEYLAAWGRPIAYDYVRGR